VCCWQSANSVATCSAACTSANSKIQLCDPSASGECRQGSCHSYTGTGLPPGYATCQ
jgi:hypothetical protein